MRAVVLGALAATAIGAPLHAQHTLAFRITPYAGYAIFGDYLEGPLNITLSNDNAALFGGQLTFNVTPSFGVYANVAFSESDWTFDNIPGLGDATVGGADLLLCDGGVHIAFPVGPQVPFGPRVAPFIQLGAGAIRYGLEENRITALLDRRSATNFAANGAVGLDVQLNRTLGARVMAKDYLVSFRSNEFEELRLEGKWAHNLAFILGLSLGF